MQKSLFLKLVVLSLIGLPLLLAIFSVWGLISERSRRRAKAVASIAASAGEGPTLVGPLVVIPYTRAEPAGLVRRFVVLQPKSLQIDAKAKVERRARGIFEAAVVTTQQTLRGEFEIPAHAVPASAEKPLLVVGVPDARCIRSPPRVRVGTFELSPNPGLGSLSDSGFNVVLDSRFLAGRTYAFEIDLALGGTESMKWSAAADDLRVSLDSDWPHPAFDGAFLPSTRTITREGFKAEWVVNRFATGMPSTRDVDESDLSTFHRGLFGVSLVNPVDVYVLTERAVKYGFLFLFVTFGAFLLFELLAGLRIHPLQYGLVGIALAIFFVLLLALAEHLPFELAYAIAAGVNTLLLTAYTLSFLDRTRRALAFGAGMALLYGAMNVLLFAEDYALLLGAGLLFTLMALVMFLTRRLDWYSVQAQKPPTVAAP